MTKTGTGSDTRSSNDEKRSFSFLIALLLVLSVFSSCADSREDEEPSETASTAAPTEPEPEETEPEEETVPAPEFPADLDFGGAGFTFGVVDNPNMKSGLIVEELNGEVLNYALFTTVAESDNALNVKIGEYVMTNGYPAASSITPMIQVGDDVIQVANVFCVDAPTLMSKGYTVDYNSLPYLDSEKPYWDGKVNDALVLADVRYAMIGDLSITTHDLTYILLFSSDLVEKNGLERPYSLVFEGKWTMDRMKEMMETVLSDANGNGKRDAEDVVGYLGHAKMVLPSFWVGAGEKCMELDEDGVPALTMTDERFLSVFEKIFSMTYDNGAWFRTAEDVDVPTQCTSMFAENHALFLDCSFFYVAALREMETDFGIIPYPKYDEEQKDYCARVSYFMPPIIPITNQNAEMTGAVLEEANYRAKLHLTPAYYDITLKGKYSRDPESIAMLDLIFANRVVDLGDSLFCVNVRDGFVFSMFSSDNRDLVSTVKKNEKIVNKTARKMIDELRNGD